MWEDFNIKQNAKIIILCLLLCVLLGLSCVNAADNTTSDQETMGTTDAIDVAKIADNDSEDDEKLSTADSNTIIGSDDNVKNLRNNNDYEILTSSKEINNLTYLNKLIKYSSGSLTVDEDFKYDSGDSAIILSKNNFILDFNNHTIDAGNYDGNLITVSGDNVLIKNLNIINSKSTSDYAISWTGSNGVLNNFNMSDSYRGISWTGETGELNHAIFNKMSRDYALSATSYFKFRNSILKNSMPTGSLISMGNYASVSNFTMINVISANNDVTVKKLGLKICIFAENFF